MGRFHSITHCCTTIVAVRPGAFYGSQLQRESRWQREPSWWCLALVAIGLTAVTWGTPADAACGDWLAGHSGPPASNASDAALIASPEQLAFSSLKGSSLKGSSLKGHGRGETLGMHVRGQQAAGSSAAFGHTVEGSPIPTPCTGPACSQLPELPLTPLGSPETRVSVGQRHAWIAHATAWRNRAIGWLMAEEQFRPLDGSSSRIERPPMHG